MLGILAMNIVSFGLPVAAYIDPTAWGGDRPVDIAAWAIAYIFVDGKMRALFTMLFGASILLFAERVEAAGGAPARAHVARMAVLLAIGMLHAWLVWYGDILVDYALVGLVMTLVWRWPPAALAAAALTMLALATFIDASAWIGQTLAQVPDPPLDRAVMAEEVRLYRGGVADVFQARTPTTIFFQTQVIPGSFPETLAFAGFGAWLYRIGLLTAARPDRLYRALVLAGLAAAALTAPLAMSTIASGFDLPTMLRNDVASRLLRPWIATAYLSALILWLRRGGADALRGRIEAAGRMALSNYLLSSLVGTTIFYGYGLGLFGWLGRADLYLVVPLVWAIILAWSRPWLQRFAQGPAEWLWRSLARGAAQPVFRR